MVNFGHIYRDAIVKKQKGKIKKQNEKQKTIVHIGVQGVGMTRKMKALKTKKATTRKKSTKKISTSSIPNDVIDYIDNHLKPENISKPSSVTDYIQNHLKTNPKISSKTFTTLKTIPLYVKTLSVFKPVRNSQTRKQIRRTV